MRKFIFLALVLVLSSALVFAAVNVSADVLSLGDVVDGSELDGATVNGNATVESAKEEAFREDGTEYTQMLTLSPLASLSFSASTGELVKVVGAVPDDGSEFSLKLVGPESENLVFDSSSDGGVVYAESVIPADGEYTLSPVEGSASIYSLVVE